MLFPIWILRCGVWPFSLWCVDSTVAGPVVENPPSNAGDLGSIPGWGTKILPATWKLHVGLIAYVACGVSLRPLHWEVGSQPLNTREAPQSWVFGEESSVAPLIRKSTSALSAPRPFVHSY